MDKFYLNKFKTYLQENDKSEKKIDNYIDNVILFIPYFNQTESEEHI
jgi:integrase/recombinase XerC